MQGKMLLARFTHKMHGGHDSEHSTAHDTRSTQQTRMNVQDVASTELSCSWQLRRSPSLMLRRWLHAASSAHQLHPPLSVLIHLRQH